MTNHPSLGTITDANFFVIEHSNKNNAADSVIPQEQVANLRAMQLLAQKFGEDWYISHDHAD